MALIDKLLAGCTSLQAVLEFKGLWYELWRILPIILDNAFCGRTMQAFVDDSGYWILMFWNHFGQSSSCCCCCCCPSTTIDRHVFVLYAFFGQSLLLQGSCWTQNSWSVLLENYYFLNKNHSIQHRQKTRKHSWPVWRSLGVLNYSFMLFPT